MARKFYNPRTYPIHVADGRPVAPGGDFTGNPDDDEWLQALLVAGDAVPVVAASADEDAAAAAADVAERAAAAAKVQARASTGDNEVVPEKAATPKETK